MVGISLSESAFCNLQLRYRKDLNKTPPESVLLPITTHLPHFLNKRQPKLQARDAGIW